MSELKPCPFCGGEAETLTAESMYGGYLFGIMCNDCCSRGDIYATEAEAIAAWNSRAERTCESVNVNGYAFRFECSSCGYVAIVHNCEIRLDELPNYCPNCGARVTPKNSETTPKVVSE